MRMIAIVLASAAIAGPALAGANFAPYEGKDAIAEGRGGTRVTKDGVDFWTTGEPPRRYQVLGVLSDKRGTGALSGKAIGGGTAKHVREIGGDAAIILGEDTQAVGAMVMQGGMVGVARRKTTQMLVVKYLDEPATQ